jgi:nucleoside-diphosphate-sugar epimerase
VLLPGVDIIPVKSYGKLDIDRLVGGRDWLLDAGGPYPLEMNTRASVLREFELEMRERARAVRHAGVGLVYVSSFVTLLGEQRAHPYYVLKKRLEQLVVAERRSGLNAIVVNPPACFGPYDNKPKHLAILAALAEGDVPMMLDSALRFVDVRDLAADVVSSMEAGRLLGPAPIAAQSSSLREIATQISSLTGTPPPAFVSVPSTLARFGASVSELACSLVGLRSPLPALAVLLLTDSANELQGRPLAPARSRRSLETTLRDSLDWYYTEGCMKNRRIPVAPFGTAHNRQ